MPDTELKQIQAWERSWVDTIINDNRSIYDETFNLILHLRRMRALRIRGQTPRSFSKIMGAGIRAPMSWAHIQTVVGLIAKNYPTFESIPLRPADKESRQRLVNTALPTLHSLERAARRPLYTLFADQLAADGRGVYKIRVTPWEGHPIQEDGESDKAFNKRCDEWYDSTSTTPFRVTLADPLNFMPAREEWDCPYVIEQGMRDTRSTLSRLNLGMDAAGNIKPMRQLTRGKSYADLTLPRGVGVTMPVEEVWTDNEVYIRLNGEYWKMDNPLGFKPYVWRFGEQTSIPDPALEGVSSIFPFLGIEPWLNTILSVIAAWAVLGSTPILWTSRDASASTPTSKAPVTDIPLGKRIDLGPGGKIGFVEPPGVGREVIEFAQTLLNFYERAGITPLARGLIGTRTPGLTLSSALEAATDKLKPTIFSLEDGTAELIQRIWMITENVIKRPVPVVGTGFVRGPMGIGKRQQRARFYIDPKDIKGYYDLSATVKLANLQDLVSQGMHAAFMVAHKLWSKERGMRFAGVDDPFDEYKQIVREEFRDDPMVKQILKDSAVQEEPELAAALVKLIQQGQMEMENMENAMPDEAPEEDATFGGAPQPRGQAAPGAGGAAAGRPRRPTGPRNTKQGQRFGGGRPR